jgi:hypothetical protein
VGNCNIDTSQFLISFGRYAPIKLFSSGVGNFYNYNNLYNSNPEQIPPFIRTTTNVYEDLTIVGDYYQFSETEDCIYFYVYIPGDPPETVPTVTAAYLNSSTYPIIECVDIFCEAHEQYDMDNPMYGDHGTIIKQCGYKYSGSISVLTYIQKYPADKDPTTVIEIRQCRNDKSRTVFESYGYASVDVPEAIWFNNNGWTLINSKESSPDILPYKLTSLKNKTTSGTEIYCCHDCIDCHCATCDLNAIVAGLTYDTVPFYGPISVMGTEIIYDDRSGYGFGNIIRLTLSVGGAEYSTNYSPGGWLLPYSTSIFLIGYIVQYDIDINDYVEPFTSFTYTGICKHLMGVSKDPVESYYVSVTPGSSSGYGSWQYYYGPLTFDIAADSTVSNIHVNGRIEDYGNTSPGLSYYAIGACNTGGNRSPPMVDSITFIPKGTWDQYTNPEYVKGLILSMGSPQYGMPTNISYSGRTLKHPLIHVLIDTELTFTIRSTRHGFTKGTYKIQDSGNDITLTSIMPYTHIYSPEFYTPDHKIWHYPYKYTPDTYPHVGSVCTMADFASHTIDTIDTTTITFTGENSAGKSKTTPTLKFKSYHPVVITSVSVQGNNVDEDLNFRYPCKISSDIIYDYPSHGVDTITTSLCFATNGTISKTYINVPYIEFATTMLNTEYYLDVLCKNSKTYSSLFTIDDFRQGETYDSASTSVFKVNDPHPSILETSLQYLDNTFTLTSPYTNIIWKSITYDVSVLIEPLSEDDPNAEPEYETTQYINTETNLSFECNDFHHVTITLINHLDEEFQTIYYKVT